MSRQYLSKVGSGIKTELSRDWPKKFPSVSITPTTRNGVPSIFISFPRGSSLGKRARTTSCASIATFSRPAMSFAVTKCPRSTYCESVYSYSGVTPKRTGVSVSLSE